MPQIQSEIMRKLYAEDIWASFLPLRNSDHSEAVQGWNGNHPCLRRLAAVPSGSVIIDVGVWKGQSTISLASVLKERSVDACVVAVDTFLGSTEHWSSERRLFKRQNGMPDLYTTFLQNIYAAGLSEYVIPMPQTSCAAAEILKKAEISAVLVHIDAAHDYQGVLQDAEAYWGILENGGVLSGDDYHESWPGVVQAVGEFSSRVLRPLTIDRPKWFIVK